MATTVSMDVAGKSATLALEEALRKAGAAEGDILLDFASVRRLDANAVRVMKQLADTAGNKGVKVALRGISVEVYRVLKLLELAPRFSFIN